MFKIINQQSKELKIFNEVNYILKNNLYLKNNEYKTFEVNINLYLISQNFINFYNPFDEIIISKNDYKFLDQICNIFQNKIKYIIQKENDIYNSDISNDDDIIIFYNKDYEKKLMETLKNIKDNKINNSLIINNENLLLDYLYFNKKETIDFLNFYTLNFKSNKDTNHFSIFIEHDEINNLIKYIPKKIREINILCSKINIIFTFELNYYNTFEEFLDIEYD